MMVKKEHVRKGFNILVYIFAAIGFVLVVGYFAVRFGFTNQTGIIDIQRESFLNGITATTTESSAKVPWSETEEWQTLSAAMARDAAVINKAAQDSGVPARLIAANLFTEQMRLFFTDREDYKQFFYPLKILGSQTQFSWGVMGMKEATAVQVEDNLKNPTSPYYPGAQYEHLLDFPATTTDISAARFTRMTDQHNHYWSYLYAGLYMKEVETQWAKAGYPIANNPSIVSTLFNIGFQHSTPNPAPQVGGAEITIANIPYSFGGLAADFYTSTLLTNQFPK